MPLPPRGTAGLRGHAACCRIGPAETGTPIPYNPRILFPSFQLRPETRLASTKQADPQNENNRPLPQDFETALAELEALVAAMEDGSLPLEQSLAAYRRGVELTRICQERLAQAEQQVKVLEGDLLRPLDPTALDDE